MFLLRDLPDDTLIAAFQIRYPEMDASAVKAFLHLMRTGSDVLRAAEGMFARYGISQGRFCVLIVLHRSPFDAIGLSSLAEKVGVTRATVTGLVDNLEKDGFLERLPDPDDRRRMQVRMTDRGRSLMESILPDYYRRVSQLMADVDEESRARLAGILAGVNRGVPRM